jgi:hypothetical protein
LRVPVGVEEARPAQVPVPLGDPGLDRGGAQRALGRHRPAAGHGDRAAVHRQRAVTVRMPKLRAENVALVSAETVQVPSRSSVRSWSSS